MPSALPRIPVDRAFATVERTLHLNWSDRCRRCDLRDRRQRARVHELVLREGGPDDVLTYVDGALLVDLWDDLVLPVNVRAAWGPRRHRWVRRAGRSMSQPDGLTPLQVEVARIFFGLKPPRDSS